MTHTTNRIDILTADNKVELKSHILRGKFERKDLMLSVNNNNNNNN